MTQNRSHVRFRLDKACDALAEFAFDFPERDRGIFDSIVQDRCGQEFLVIGHGGRNRDGFQRMDNVGKTLALAFNALVSLYGKNNRIVK